MLRGVLQAFPPRYLKTLRQGNNRTRQYSSELSFLPSKKKLVPRPQPPPLPPSQYIEIQDRCTLEYVDIQPSSEEPVAGKTATIVMLHGAPGIKMLGSGNAFLASLASHAVKAVYTKLLRFPADWPVDPFVAAVVRAGTNDFDLARDQVALMRSLNMPTLIAWSQTDEYIQEEVPLELEKPCSGGPRICGWGGTTSRKRAWTRLEPLSMFGLRVC